MQTNNPKHAARRKNSKAFTLLELILAIALSVTLLALIAGAVHLFINRADNNRREVEEAQLARAILQKMSDDLQAAFYHVEQDTSTAMSLAEETAAFDVDSLDDASTTDAPEEESSIANTAALPPIPGVYGTSAELQVDVSKMPRYEELTEQLSENNSAASDRPSDLKTVAYYLQTGTSVSAYSLAATQLQENNGQQPAGLFRRELDRATTQWAMDNGGGAGLDQSGTLLAPEVVGLEFQYFDGTDWQSEWDTSENEGLPFAVHITLWLRNEQTAEKDGAVSLGSTNDLSSTATRYEIVVALINAKEVEEE